MSTVQLRDAKARLSQLVETVEAGGHVVITKHGREVAMLVSIEEGRQLHPARSEPNFVAYLMTIPCEIPLDDTDRPRIADVHLFDEATDAAAE